MPSFDVVSEVDKHELTNAIDQANRELTTRFFLQGAEKVLITFSAGVAQLNGTESSADAISRADQAMYLAKRSGKNRVVAEYALRGVTQPMGVAEYQLINALPAQLQSSRSRRRRPPAVLCCPARVTSPNRPRRKG